MTPTRIYWLIGAVAALFVVLAVVSRFLDDGKKAELLRAPGYGLRFAGGTFFSESPPGTSILGAGTAVRCDYGTDADDAQIVAFFDAELGRLGYTPDRAAPSPGPAGSERLLATYRHGAFTYRLFLRPLPYRAGSRIISTGFRHVLVTELSNRPS